MLQAFTTGFPVAIAVAVRSLFSVSAGEFTTGAPVEMELAVKAYSSDTIPLSASGAEANGLNPNTYLSLITFLFSTPELTTEALDPIYPAI
jgi:hypothetical protein